MAQERPSTPEKQLLNLIEGQKPGSPAELNSRALKHRGLSFFSADAWVGRFAYFGDRFKKWFRRFDPDTLDIGLINNILGGVIVILLLYIIGDVSFSLAGLGKPPNLELKSQGGIKLPDFQELATFKKPASYYLEKVSERNIFKMNAGKEKTDVPDAEPVEPAGPAGPSSSIIEATGHLKLVGISWAEDPDAMIEDSKAFRTIFVKKGQMIGDVKVKAIFKDKVILSYGQEEIELK